MDRNRCCLEAHVVVPAITAVQTSPAVPKSTPIAVIGAGIVGLMAALNLAERGIPVVVLEKGRIAGEQSSRNLGWVPQNVACQTRHTTLARL
jgi:glycine/D-amino acid oxidase-like deaminating enzyme